jgi:hypothetical protein
MPSLETARDQRVHRIQSGKIDHKRELSKDRREIGCLSEAPTFGDFNQTPGETVMRI